MSQTRMKSSWNRSDRTFIPKKIPRRAVQHESQLQQSVVKWFQLQYPRTVIMSVPNGGYKANPREVQRLKREGMCIGAPDLIIMRPNNKYHALCIEMKMPGGTCSDKQLEVHGKLRLAGYYVCVINSFDGFQGIVRRYFQGVL